MVLLNFAAGRDGRADGGRAGGRANGRTSGRTDGGTAVAARGGGCGLCGVILLLRHPGRRPRRFNRLDRDRSSAAPAEARAPRRRHRRRRRSVPSTPMVSPPRPRPLSPTHPPRSDGGNVWREGNFESPYLRDCRCGFETRGGVEELPFILVSETRHGAGATGGGLPTLRGGLPTLRGGGSAGGP